MDKKNIDVKLKYSVHFVPFKVNNNIKTTEFQDSFINETNNSNYRILYLRGRKFIGKDVDHITLKPYIVATNSIPKDAQNQTQIIAKNNLTKLHSLTNYEREGNEERLIDEHHKFKELIDLTTLIHET